MNRAFIDQKQTRQALRQRMTTIRKQQSAAQIAAWSARIVARLLEHFPAPPGRCIAFCWPVKHEPDVRAALQHWQQQGAIAALPVVRASAQPLTFRAWTPDTPLAPDCYGIPTPASGDEVVPDVLLIPLNAFSAAGYRLGYGGGFFDRTLAVSTPRPLALGVGFELNRSDDFLPEAHDQRMDWIFTEAAAWPTR
jgi:5,10-methenyltetrahydrofolate synthetase